MGKAIDDNNVRIAENSLGNNGCQQSSGTCKPGHCSSKFLSPKLKSRFVDEPEWRNRQTRWIQNPVAARSCGFDSHLWYSAVVGRLESRAGGG